MASSSFDPATNVPDLSRKVIFITGGNQGLGQEAILALAPHNPSHIYFTARSVAKAEDTLTKLKTLAPNTPTTVIICDLGSLASVKDAAKILLSKTETLDVLILNAGVMGAPLGTTTDGYEIHMGTNHIGHALLTKLLLPTLENNAKTVDTRIIVLSSRGAVFSRAINYGALRTDGAAMTLLGGTTIAYCQSKLKNVYFADQLAQRYPAISSVSLHPGIVSTNLVVSQSLIQRAIISISTLWNGGMKTPAQGAYNTFWAATTKKAELKNGAYYEPVGLETKGSKVMKDKKGAEELWDWTEKELQSWSPS